jgi:hypothetical protein
MLLVTWCDSYWCMPQKTPHSDRTPAEKVQFAHMLRHASLVYLGSRVLILLDLSYLSRFWVCCHPRASPPSNTRASELMPNRVPPPPWRLCLPLTRPLLPSCPQTQFESWLSMQSPTPAGLSPAKEGEQRFDITPIENANSSFAGSLRSMWQAKTPQEAYDVLEKDDVVVTNKKDKAEQLKKLLALNEEVRTAYRTSHVEYDAVTTFKDEGKEADADVEAVVATRSEMVVAAPPPPEQSGEFLSVALSAA